LMGGTKLGGGEAPKVMLVGERGEGQTDQEADQPDRWDDPAERAECAERADCAECAECAECTDRRSGLDTRPLPPPPPPGWR